MKKAYKIARWEKTAAGFSILLDARQAKTPGGAPLVMPNEKLARAVAEEWDAQKNTVRKDTMPLTAITCIAIDLMPQKRNEALEDMLAYAETDLVCYRAGNIPALQKRQEALLNPILAWAEHCLAIQLAVTDGLMPVPQPAGNLIKLRAAVSEYNHWKLAGLAASVKQLGSIILALALVEGHIDAKKAFELSHLEETYETEQWGQDDEKETKMAKVKEEIAAAEKFLALLQ